MVTSIELNSYLSSSLYRTRQSLRRSKTLIGTVTATQLLLSEIARSLDGLWTDLESVESQFTVLQQEFLKISESEESSSILTTSIPNGAQRAEASSTDGLQAPRGASASNSKTPEAAQVAPSSTAAKKGSTASNSSQQYMLAESLPGSEHTQQLMASWEDTARRLKARQKTEQAMKRLKRKRKAPIAARRAPLRKSTATGRRSKSSAR